MLDQLRTVLFRGAAAPPEPARKVDFVVGEPPVMMRAPQPQLPVDQTPSYDDGFWEIDDDAVVNPPTGHCFDLALDTFFNGRHFVTMAGVTGPEHAHSYRMRVRCISSSLMLGDQVVVGFRELRDAVHHVVERYNNRLLNSLPAFATLQPTTENLAGVLFQQVARVIAPLPLTLTSVTVWESPTESATYRRTSL